MFKPLEQAVLPEDIERCFRPGVRHQRQAIALLVQRKQGVGHAGEQIRGKGRPTGVFDFRFLVHDRIAEIEEDCLYILGHALSPPFYSRINFSNQGMASFFRFHHKSSQM
jgi:hypothetical protein